MVAVPILTYHSANIGGNDYATNDHIAFQCDLQLVDSLGYTVVPLHLVVDALFGNGALPAKPLAIAIDDGTDFDFHDLIHTTCGMQRSMLNIMRDFLREHGETRQPMLHATAFVIVSPKTRSELDRLSMVGAGWYGDDWWKPAVQSRLIGIANHSWDHNHPLASEATGRSEVGTFRSIADRKNADEEILRAYRYIDSIAPSDSSRLFAYPYGEVNDYLLTEYFPLGETLTGTRAAFTTEPRHSCPEDSRWRLPRYVCGSHWHSGDELQRLLTT